MVKQIVEYSIGALFICFITAVFFTGAAELFFGALSKGAIIWRFPITTVIGMVGIVGTKLVFVLADKFDLHHAIK